MTEYLTSQRRNNTRMADTYMDANATVGRLPEGRYPI